MSEFEQYLKQRHLSFTRERKLLVRAICDSPNEFNADELCVWAEAHGMPLAHSTVYRNLRLLCAAGMIAPLAKAGKKNSFCRVDDDKPQIRLSGNGGGEEAVEDQALGQALLAWSRRRGIAASDLVVRIEIRSRDCRYGFEKPTTQGKENG